VVVARCSALTVDLRKLKNVGKVLMKLMKVYTVPARRLGLKGLIAHGENIRVIYAMYFCKNKLDCKIYRFEMIVY
jgi:hypothetical protein